MKDRISFLLNKINKDFLIRITPYILISYFALLLLPYIFAPIPSLYYFFLKTSVNLTLRLFATLIISIFSVSVFIRFRPKIDKKYLYFSLGLILILILSLIISPKTYRSVITHDPYAYETLVVYEIGLIDLLSGFASCVVDMFFGLLFVFVLPCVCTKQSLKPFLLFVFGFMVFECLFSIGFEFKKYIATLSAGDSAYGGYEIDISGSFISKNQFGSFLIIGFLSGFFASHWYYKDSKIFRIIIYSCLSLIGMVTVFSLCKTAILSLFLVFVFLFTLRIRKLIKEKRVAQISFIILTFLLVVIFIILVMATPIGTIGIFSKIQKGIKILFVDSFSTAKESRYIAWLLSISTLFNYHLVIGYPKGSLQYVLRIGTNGYVIYPHNGFIQQVLCYGLFGLFVLFFLYSFILKRIKWQDNKNEKRMWISLLLSAFVFMMTETEVILMSSSLLTFGFNVLLSSIPVAEIKKMKEHYYEIQV
ncbi:MAG: hypothetical protein IJK27_03515 [Bacilli bacterium]|nr:hypothetical protein [Bacilli bacterium]